MTLRNAAVYALTAMVGILVASCGDDSADETHEEHETSPCFEWQRFMRHEGLGTTEVAPGDEPGEYVFSNIGYVHGGSWELNFHAEADGEEDAVKLLLCVDGMIPFESCFDDDPSNDVENCDSAIDARCRDDEDEVGDVVDGMMGTFHAEIVSVEPEPHMDTESDNTVTVKLTDGDGEPVTDATLSKGECTEAMSGHSGHSG